MAEFQIVNREALKMIRCVLNNETVRAEAGALHYMRGQIEIANSTPTAGGFLKSMVTGETVFKPTYKGTGEIFFGPPIFGEYEILELQNEEWILEQGAYICSDISVEVSAARNKAITALFGGEGWFQVSVKGSGRVVMKSPGPIERITLRGEKLSVDGNFAIARTAGISFQVEKATKSILGSMASGEGLLSTFSGVGTVLIAPVPSMYNNLISAIQSCIPRTK